MFDIGRSGVQRLEIAAPLRWAEVILFRQGLDFEQATVTTDRFGPSPDKLHAVVVLWIVAGGYRNTTIHLGMGSGKIDFLRTTLANIKNIHARIAQAIAQGGLDLLAGEAYIVPHNDRPWIYNPGKGATNSIGSRWHGG